MFLTGVPRQRPRRPSPVRALWTERGGIVLLLVVALAVEFGVSAVAGGSERLLARCALQTLLVPGRAVDPQQEAV